MSNWIGVLEVFLEKTLQSLNEDPFPKTIEMNLEQALHTALLKINPDCSDDYLAGARDMACSYIETRLEESDYQCEWVDGENQTGHFIMSLKTETGASTSISERANVS